jgi:hypothetical protein
MLFFAKSKLIIHQQLITWWSYHDKPSTHFDRYFAKSPLKIGLETKRDKSQFQPNFPKNNQIIAFTF